MNDQVSEDTPGTDIQPIHRTPAELLAEIFLHCLPANKFIQPSPNNAPLLLGNVCSSWRRVSISTPRLWSSISVRVSHKGWEPHLSLVQLWLTRSGMCPLYLALTQSKHVDDNRNILAPCDAGPVLDLFMCHFSCWKDVFFGFENLPLEPWGEIPHTGAPLLEKVHLRLDSHLSDGQILAVSRILSSAPRLRSIFWLALYHKSCKVLAPWAQLVDLYLICRMSTNEVLDTLRLCVKAETCFFGNIIEGLANRPTYPEILLPELRQLIISFGDGLKNFLDPLTLPALEDFAIQFHFHDPPPWPQPKFVSFLSRSRCHLSSLSLEYTNISEDDLTQCLWMNSRSLRKLVIFNRRVVSITDKLFTMLTCQALEDKQSDYLCPALEVIGLAGYCFSSSDGVLADLVVSRWGPNAPDDVTRLCSVELEFAPGQTAQHPLDFARLTELRNEGLRVWLREGE